MAKISKALAIKQFMSTTERPVANNELMDLMKKDKESYNWMGEECAKQLGMELEEAK